jgi:hypothetical protein
MKKKIKELIKLCEQLGIAKLNYKAAKKLVRNKDATEQISAEDFKNIERHYKQSKALVKAAIDKMTTSEGGPLANLSFPAIWSEEIIELDPSKMTEVMFNCNKWSQVLHKPQLPSLFQKALKVKIVTNNSNTRVFLLIKAEDTIGVQDVVWHWVNDIRNNYRDIDGATVRTLDGKYTMTNLHPITVPMVDFNSPRDLEFEFGCILMVTNPRSL